MNPRKIKVVVETTTTLISFSVFHTDNSDDIHANLADIESNPSEADADVAQAAGLAEGYLTGTFISRYYQGTKSIVVF